MIHQQPAQPGSFKHMIGNLIGAAPTSPSNSQRNRATNNPAWRISCQMSNVASFSVSRAAIVKAISDNGPLSRVEIVELASVSICTAAKHLKLMKATGEIRNFGTETRPRWGLCA